MPGDKLSEAEAAELERLHANAEPCDGGPWGTVSADDRSWGADAHRWGSASHEAFPRLLAERKATAEALRVARERARRLGLALVSARAALARIKECM